MRAVVEVGDGWLVRRVAAPGDARAERDLGHRHLPVGVLLQHAFRFVDIIIDDQPRAPGEVDEEQHVAGGERGDEGLLRVDPCRVRPGRRNDVRARGGRHHRAAVERPFVRAAVLALGEVAALADPADLGGVGVHYSA